MKMASQLSQAFPPAPKFTEENVPDLTSKVYIVTGASAGVGKELARLLYSRSGTVYVAARSAEKANTAISWIKERHPNATGQLHFLKLDLNDLRGIKSSAEEFLSKEQRLDVLFNNAGVMMPPQGSKTEQGYELQIGTNCLAPFLFTKLLTPLIVQTAKSSPPGSIRVAWVSSSAAEVVAPRGGVDMDNLDYKKDQSATTKYAISKAGNVLHAIEYQRRHKNDGVVSTALHPGLFKSELTRHSGTLLSLLSRPFQHEPVYGAYTELFVGLAPEAANLKEGDWVIPWGRIVEVRKDLVADGKAGPFWEWSEKQVEPYA
ncbi:hypothetical protein COCVIDRAFT_14490 [Bipolaris victoriae FI3]|uniref:Short-chain dehydrogenase n=1 Tax=Bipolaris victoriae (strain FI3) TaxID=930091 RepID=W7EPC6_BIPV3|nr:hypothetical protein COCVIDRAFT_14490 [Bipolaris victoriae FI3]